MSQSQDDGPTVISWLQKNGLALASVLFASGIAYSQLNNLSSRLDETASEIKELRRELVELRVNGVGTPKDAYESFVTHQATLDSRQDRELELLRARLVELRVDLQKVLARRAPTP